MVLEVAVLYIKPKKAKEFQKAFQEAETIISSMKGYISHELKKCIEKENQYILLVNWETLKDHEEGFRNSPMYKEWAAKLHDFYDPFPTVEHYEQL